MALDLPKPWPACPGCSQSVTSAVPIRSTGNWTAHPCGCVVTWTTVAKVIRVSGANA